MSFPNPFRPGAGHRPPYLAGRKNEIKEFRRLLDQREILDNFILTGLRGVGKTVLLDELKPIALHAGWGWVGSDLSETSSVSEANLSIRILTDLSPLTSSIVVDKTESVPLGFASKPTENESVLNFDTLNNLYQVTPGLSTDKLKRVLEFVHSRLPENRKRIIFAYDEAQNLADNAASDQYPLSLLLDVFQSIQRKGIPFMLALVGLPTLFGKLVDARTYAERMFRVMFLDQLSMAESRQAVVKPLQHCPVTPTEESINAICELAGGYPYFIQFIGREVYDIWLLNSEASIPVADINQKLDADFFAGRWDRASDRQRDLLTIIARLENAEQEFTVQGIVTESGKTPKPFSNSHVNQMLAKLGEKGLVYKNRHGKYSFAVPLLARFIRRQLTENP